MASKFECPRCGAGIRPGDIQCGRCGVTLNDRGEVETVPTPSVTLRSIGGPIERKVRVDPGGETSPRLRSFLERKERELERRERDLRRREEEMRRSMEQMENDAKALDTAVERFERDMAELERRRAELEERQVCMEGQSGRVPVISDRQMGGKEATRDLADAIAEFRAMLEWERERIHRDMKQGDEGSLEELFLLEGQLRAAADSLETGPGLRGEEVVDSPEENTAIMREVFDILNDQIGAGFEGQAGEEIMPTYISKLDEILGGGIPPGHVLVINGTTGAMKSSLAYQVLHRNTVRGGRRCLYFSLEQTRESIERQMVRMGMSSKGVTDLIVSDMVELKKAMRGVEGNWREILMRFVREIVETRGIEILALDSLESFKAMTEFAFTREDLREFFDWFRAMGITVLLTSELPLDELTESSQGEIYLSDGAIELMMRDPGNGRIQRWLRCPKMRGAPVDTRYYAFSFEGGEFIIRSPLV